jgi:hypothetical protein
MTQNDIISWAHKSGFLIDTHAQQYQPNCILSTHGLIDENLERFANLVANHEREECAKLAEKTICDKHIPTGVSIYGTRAAKAIRARGNHD